MPKAKAQDYEYKLPDDYEMKPELRMRLDALVDEAGLSEVLAQRFIDLYVELMEDYAERLEESKNSDYLPSDESITKNS